MQPLAPRPFCQRARRHWRLFAGTWFGYTAFLSGAPWYRTRRRRPAVSAPRARQIAARARRAWRGKVEAWKRRRWRGGLNILVMCSRFADEPRAAFVPSPWWNGRALTYPSAPFWLRKRQRGRIIYRAHRRGRTFARKIGRSGRSGRIA
jgi:hypothetical protein